MLVLGQALSKISLMEQQFVVTHTICQSDIPALLDSRVTNTPSVKMLCPEKNCLSYFCKIVTCLSVGLMRVSQVFPSTVILCAGGLRHE